jgi:hypothetical protein
MEREKVMQKLVQVVLVAALIVACSCGSVLAQQGKDWYLAFRLGYQPYDLDTKGTLNGRDFDYDTSLSDIKDKSDLTIFGGEVEFSKCKWFIVVSGFHQTIEDDAGNTTNGYDVSFKKTAINPMFGYHIYRQELGGGRAFAIDVMAGAYYVKLESDVAIYSNGVNLGGDRNINFTDPMVGMRLNYGFTKRFGIGFSGEIGSGGSELQYVAAANLSYKLTNNIGVFGGYKYWYYKWKDSDKALSEFEQKQYGPVAGIQLMF